MRRALWIAVAALGVAACGGGGKEEFRGAFDGVFSCDSKAVQVTFDPAESVTVAAGGVELATATFTERRVSEDCDVVPGAPRTTMKGSPYDGESLGEGIYRRAELECSVAGGVRIDVHPIFNANVGRNDGSVLLVVDGRTIVVSAVLKNKGDPQASRVYHAPRYCTAA
jgi:hypothetical protein